jgi:hypothetical protein
VYQRRAKKEDTAEITEFSYSYGHRSHNCNTLETVDEQKTRTSRELANETRGLLNQLANVTAIIVSSMGAVYEPSLEALQTNLGRNGLEVGALGRQISEAAIMKSMKIWHTIMRNKQRGVSSGEEEDAMIAEALRKAEEAE